MACWVWSRLGAFDYGLYISVCNKASVSWYVSMEEDAFRLCFCLPLSQSRANQRRLSSLFAWANRTDPGGLIRFENLKKEYLERNL